MRLLPILCQGQDISEVLTNHLSHSKSLGIASPMWAIEKVQYTGHSAPSHKATLPQTSYMKHTQEFIMDGAEI